MAKYTLEDVNSPENSKINVSPPAGERPQYTEEDVAGGGPAAVEEPQTTEEMDANRREYSPYVGGGETAHAVTTGLEKGFTLGAKEHLDGAILTVADPWVNAAKKLLGYEVEELPPDETIIESYYRNVAKVGARMDQLEADKPVASLIGEAAGNTMLAAGTAGATGFGSYIANASKWTKAAAATTAGLATAVMTAFNTGEDKSDAAWQGGVGGLVSYPIASLGGGLIKQFAGNKHVNKAMDVVIDKLSKGMNMAKEDIPYHRLLAKLQNMGKDATPAEAHQSMTNLVQDIASNPKTNAAANNFAALSAERAKYSPEIFQKETEALFSSTPTISRVDHLAAHKAANDITSAERDKAMQHSDAATVAVKRVETAIADFFDDGNSTDAVVAANLRKGLFHASRQDKDVILSTEKLVQMRQEVDKVLNRGAMTKEGGITAVDADSRDNLLKFRHELNEEIHSFEPMKIADGKFASDAEMKKAIKIGDNILKPSVTSTDINDFMSVAKPVQKAGFEQGAKRAIMEALKRDPAAAAKKLGKGGEYYTKLEGMVGSDMLDQLIASAKKTNKYISMDEIMKKSGLDAAGTEGGATGLKKAIDKATILSAFLTPKGLPSAGVASGLGAAGREAGSLTGLNPKTGKEVMKFLGTQKEGASGFLMDLMQRSQLPIGGVAPLVGGVTGGVGASKAGQ